MTAKDSGGSCTRIARLCPVRQSGSNPHEREVGPARICLPRLADRVVRSRRTAIGECLAGVRQVKPNLCPSDLVQTITACRLLPLCRKVLGRQVTSSTAPKITHKHSHNAARVSHFAQPLSPACCNGPGPHHPSVPATRCQFTSW